MSSHTVTTAVAQRIEATLQQALPCDYLELVNESHLHGRGELDSHYKLTLVSEQFAGLSRIARHRLLNQLLAAELAGPLHALALHLYSPSEWQQRQQLAPSSPACRGGSKTP
ncbi:MAG: DNA-binding transcriptional regulator BolA [Pseudidiomarina mangrovi]|nr:MAG: DNA-binding transcriptional regulator BolA [Pseudidiomarina mangrovi]